MPSRPKRVAVVGDGPAGSTLAALLARSGIECVVFAPSRRPKLLVGESLVPAVVPILSRLGVEEEIAASSVYKPGASFTATPDVRMHFSFENVAGASPGYAYNVSRDEFDATLREAARRAGARFVDAPGRFESGTGDRVELDGESRDRLGGFEPDRIVDATGRARVVSRLLDLPGRRVWRRDAALFAHRRGVPLDRAGHVHTDRLDEGWGWRIPLSDDRVSVGVVRSPERLRRFGSTAQAQYEGALEEDPFFGSLLASSERVSEVARFDNYQWCSLRGVGANWALVGDAFGFVDPVFSSGLFLAMDSAERLADALASGTERALRAYERSVRAHVEAWQRVAGYYYDGRMLRLFELGTQTARSTLGRLGAAHLSRQLPRVLTGDGVTRWYPRMLLGFMIRRALRGRDPEAYAIR